MKSKTEIIKLSTIVLLVIFTYLTRETWIEILIMFSLGGGFALLSLPVCKYMENRGICRSLSALGGIAVFCMGLVLFLVLFLPYLFTQTIELIQRIIPTILLCIDTVHELLTRWGIDILPQSELPQLLLSSLTPLSSGLARGGAWLISIVGQAAFALVIAFYILTERQAIGCHLQLLVPIRWRSAFLSTLRGCRNDTLSYLSGMLKTSLFVCAMTFAGLFFLGIKEAAILALFMGILEVLPYIGPVLGAIPILLSALPLGFGKTLMALLIVFLVQQAESVLIGPYFTASSTSLHPMTAIISVYIGGSLFGIPGILIAVPLVIVFRSIGWSVRSMSIHFD